MRTDYRLATGSVLLVVLCAGCCCCETETSTPAQRLLTSSEEPISSQGEIPIDFETNKKLPEELDDGELETGDKHAVWNYTEQGKWASEYPQCQGVKLRQSPIDIVTDQVTFGPKMKLSFVDYDQEVEFEVKNTHHSVSLTPVGSLSRPGIWLNFVDCGADYELQEIHFHWGDGVNKGSEHEINDQRAAAEMHMVHYRKGIDKSQIGNVENSVAVVGVLIESDELEHNKLEPIVEKTGHVNGTDLEYKDDSPVNLIKLLPDNHHGFFTYNGSLTTPPCYEVVTWIIMSEPVYMNQQTLVALSNLEAKLPAKGRQKIARNFRNVQPLLNRPVYASFNASDTNTYTKLDSLIKQIEHKNKNGIKTNETMSMIMAEYWRKINSLPGSLRKAFGQINNARRELWQKLRREVAAKQQKQQQQKQPTNISTLAPSPVVKRSIID